MFNFVAGDCLWSLERHSCLKSPELLLIKFFLFVVDSPLENKLDLDLGLHILLQSVVCFIYMGIV
jgi:hypothetical protein